MNSVTSNDSLEVPERMKCYVIYDEFTVLNPTVLLTVDYSKNIINKNVAFVANTIAYRTYTNSS